MDIPLTLYRVHAQLQHQMQYEDIGVLNV